MWTGRVPILPGGALPLGSGHPNSSKSEPLELEAAGKPSRVGKNGYPNSVFMAGIK
jgi:hypothetical protein